MDTAICKHAFRLALEPGTTVEVLAARLHVSQCPNCQRVLGSIWPLFTGVSRHDTVERLVGRDLSDTIINRARGLLEWVVRDTQAWLLTLAHLGELPQQELPSTATTLSTRNQARPRVVRRYEHRTADESIAWSVTFVEDSDDAEQCTADVRIELFGARDRSGMKVFMLWDEEQRQALTDATGRVQIAPIPKRVLDRIDLVICAPQLPTRTNDPQ